MGEIISPFLYNYYILNCRYYFINSTPSEIFFNGTFYGYVAPNDRCIMFNVILFRIFEFQDPRSIKLSSTVDILLMLHLNFGAKFYRRGE